MHRSVSMSVWRTIVSFRCRPERESAGAERDPAPAVKLESGTVAGESAAVNAASESVRQRSRREYL